MAEYIEREKVIRELEWYIERFPDCSECLEARKHIIAYIPAADVRPVVKGFNKLKDYPSLFECSVCGWECDDTIPGDTTTYNFCPNCGAEMEES